MLAVMVGTYLINWAADGNGLLNTQSFPIWLIFLPQLAVYLLPVPATMRFPVAVLLTLSPILVSMSAP